MQEIIGQFLILIMKLIKEFNEEFFEQTLKELNKRPEDIKPDGWYSVDKIVFTLEKLSDEANLALGKLVIGGDPNAAKVMKPDSSPLDMISLIKAESSKLFKGDNLFSLMTVIDSGPDSLVVKTKLYPFTESFFRGVILGFLQILKIFKVNINKRDEDDFQIFTIKWQ